MKEITVLRRGVEGMRVLRGDDPHVLIAVHGVAPELIRKTHVYANYIDDGTQECIHYFSAETIFYDALRRPSTLLLQD